MLNKKTLSKTVLAILLSSGVLATAAHAFDIRVTNNTHRDIQTTCMSGECAALQTFNDSTVGKHEIKTYPVLPNFAAQVKLKSESGECIYKVQHTVGGDGVLTVDKLSCTGDFDGNQHDDADHVESFVNIILTGK